MTDRPIIFSAALVKALLAGRKTVTRRILSPRNTSRAGRPWSDSKHAPWDAHDWNDVVVDPGPSPAGNAGPYLKVAFQEQGTRHRIYPIWAAGDRLWVRENHAIVPWTAYRASEGVQQIRSTQDPDDAAIYAAGWERSKPRWRPSIHMPRWASRLTLLVGEVRVQRLLDISEQDAEAEGVCHFVEEGHGSESWQGLGGADRSALVCFVYGSSRKAFQHLWETLNGPEAWDANPWVGAISFTVHRANIDTLPEQEAA